MIVFYVSSLGVALTSIILTVHTFIYGKSKLHRLWAVFNISVAVWGLGCFLAAIANTHQKAFFAWKIALIGGVFISTTFYHTVCTFCNIKRRTLLIVFYLIDACFVILMLLKTEALLSNQVRSYHNIFYFKTTPIYLISLIGWLSVAILGLFELYKLSASTKGIKHIQTLYFFTGSLIGFIGGTSIHLPLIGLPVYPIGNFGVAIYAILATYAILKYRLLDIKVAITRTGLFVGIYTLILGLPFALAAYFKDHLIENLGPHWWTAPLGLMAAMATVGPFVYIYFQKRAEAALLREQRRYQDSLKHAAVGMTRIRNLRKLLSLIAHIVTKTVRVSFAAVYLLDEEKEKFVLQVSRDRGGTEPTSEISAYIPLIHVLTIKRQPLVYEEVKRQMQDSHDKVMKGLEENMRQLNAAVVIPSFLDHTLIGLIVLGEKLSGQMYTPDDLTVFEVLASQAALAIENAQFYEEAKEMQAQIGQAEKMATIGTMADGLSHQINNRFYALSLIAGDTIDTIKLTDTARCSPEIQEMIKQINSALERIQVNVMQGGEVVKGILKYTRKGDEGMEALTIDQIIDGTILMVQYKVKLGEIDIIRDYPKDTPKLKANLVQMQEVFFNFIDNAYDSIVERKTLLKEPGYRGKIVVSARKSNTDNIIEITISDNGMGVRQEDIKKIFTPFFTTKVSSRKGTGLGLYVIRNIITESHNGKINFSSEYKRGTKFILELPIAGQ
jgi:signal transduction histidine kinase